jgi:hypothetical protein
LNAKNKGASTIYSIQHSALFPGASANRLTLRQLAKPVIAAAGGGPRNFRIGAASEGVPESWA